MKPELLFGVLQHYKGGLYFVIGASTHTETKEITVVHRSMADNVIWNRPIDMFNSEVEVEGRMVPRFRKIPMRVEDCPNYPRLKISDQRGGH